MTANAWLQIVAFLWYGRGLGEAPRLVHGPRLRGEAVRPRPRPRTRGAVDLPRLRRPSPRRRWTGRPTPRPCSSLTSLASWRYTPSSALRASCPSTQRTSERWPRIRLQHGHQLRHEHQLAGLRGRKYHELPDPDGGPRGAELPLRCRRDGRAGRADPRHRSETAGHHRELLDRHGEGHAVHPLCPCPSSSRWPWSPRGSSRALLGASLRASHPARDLRAG